MGFEILYWKQPLVGAFGLERQCAGLRLRPVVRGPALIPTCIRRRWQRCRHWSVWAADAAQRIAEFDIGFQFRLRFGGQVVDRLAPHGGTHRPGAMPSEPPVLNAHLPRSYVICTSAVDVSGLDHWESARASPSGYPGHGLRPAVLARVLQGRGSRVMKGHSENNLD